MNTEVTTVKFPMWDDNPKLTDAERAKLRRNFMLRQAAIAASPSGSIKQFVKQHGIDRTTIYYAIRAGEISENLAARLEKAAGLDDNGNPILPAKAFRFPLQITTE